VLDGTSTVFLLMKYYTLFTSAVAAEFGDESKEVECLQNLLAQFRRYMILDNSEHAATFGGDEHKA